MRHPEKWRKTCDPFAVPLRKFHLEQVLGYPHAGNDVFHVEGYYRGEKRRAYLKVDRQKGADTANEAAILRQLRNPVIPEVLEYGKGFCLTGELPGERLSVILGDNASLESMDYLEEYGRMLAWLHQQTPEVSPVKDRKFFHRPPSELLEQLGLSQLDRFFDRKPETEHLCFCHGDFHYANLLWQNGRISGVLDFELAGCGNRDFDIAWALLLRPGQKFLRTEAERQQFLKGYSLLGDYDPAAVRYYLAQASVWFLQLAQEDQTYCANLRSWLREQLV